MRPAGLHHRPSTRPTRRRAGRPGRGRPRGRPRRPSRRPTSTDGAAHARWTATGPPPHVLICGVLHFAGEVLAHEPGDLADLKAIPPSRGGWRARPDGWERADAAQRSSATSTRPLRGVPPKGGRTCRGRDAGLGQPFEDLLLGHGADLHRGHLAVLEQHHGRDAAHAVARGRGRAVLDVQLGDGDLAGQLVGDLLQRRGDLLAGAAPLGPEVDQHRACRPSGRPARSFVGDLDGAHGNAPYARGSRTSAARF